MARNPLLSIQQNTSKNPQDHSGYVEPVPEDYAGDNNPYRGLENHGVAPTYEPDDPNVEYDNGEATRLAEYTEAPPDPDPIPVRIVSDGGSSVKTSRIYTLPVPNDGTPVQLLPRMKERTQAIIRNGAGAAWVNSDRSAIAQWSSFPLDANAQMTIGSQNELFVASLTGTVVSVYVEYSVSD